MKYDFESILERKGLDATAVDAIGKSVPWAEVPTSPKNGFSAIPMWVADMNFATVPTVQSAVAERVSHPTFGYFGIRDEYYSSIIKWHKEHNANYDIKPEFIGYENGVLGCVSSAVQVFTTPGEKILIHSPTYIGFTHVLEDTGRVAELSELVLDDGGVFRMDYEDMENRIKDNNIHLVIFCSPHNPCGRVWEREEIEKAFEIFKKYDCIVISDEIWSDIVLNGNRHIPTALINEDAKNRTISVYAPSKTFNLAGLIGSYHIIYNKYLRDRVRRQSAASHYNDINVLSMYALIGAYKEEGCEWVSELLSVLSKNINYAYDFITQNFDGVSVSKPQGTYMMFLHCEDYCRKNSITTDELVRRGWDCGVAWQKGDAFHDEWGVRMNFALPFSLAAEALDRLKKYVFI